MGDLDRERIAGIIGSAEVLSGPAAAQVADDDQGEDGGDACFPPDAEATPELNQKLAFLPLTDLGNAERFVARFGHEFLWCSAIGWLNWDGRRWARQASMGAVETTVHRVVRLIQDEAAAIRGSNLDFVVKEGKKKTDPPQMYSDKVAAWGRMSEMNSRIRAVSEIAGPKLEVAAAELDADPFRINLRNGTLAVSRRENEAGDFITLLPHDPQDRITKLAPVDYDPDAERAAFDGFLKRVQPDAANRRFLAQWLGLSLTGDVSEQKLAFFWGKGKNGKSTLIDIVALIAGDYSETVPVETFLSEGRGRNAGAATPDLAILPGVRMLRTSEPEKGSKLAEALIKLCTGGEPIQARHLNRDYFRFYPQFKLSMSGNHRPMVSGADEGIWRRVMLVPWTETISEEERDLGLPAKLRAEMPGILNWLLDGLRDWLAAGLVQPRDVIDATRQYREESDPLGRFLGVCVEPSPGGRVASALMYDLFKAWTRASGEREWTATGFGRAMGERGYRRLHSNGVWWCDVRLVKAPSDFAPPEPAASPGAAPSPAGEGDYE